jgi:hypothetical protein
MPDRLSGLIFAQIGKRSIFFFIFPSLTNFHVIADKVQLFTMTPETCALVVGCQWDTLNSDLGHKAVVVVITV